MLPHYLAIGVDFKTFMECNPYELRAYDKAHNQKQQLFDGLMWQMGIYVRLAIGSAMNKENKYPENPMSLQKKELSTENDPEANERLAAAEMQVWIAALKKQGNLPETEFTDIRRH